MVYRSEVNNLEIAANDKYLRFCLRDPWSKYKQSPFYYTGQHSDKLQWEWSLGTVKAWGQNAHFFRNKKLKPTKHGWMICLCYSWLTDIDTRKFLLSIKVPHLCACWCSIIINGILPGKWTKRILADRVYFRGERLDDPYKDFPASWPRYFFYERQ